MSNNELNPEHRLIPFETSPLPTGPWLVFAPHADDETYGMGGSLLKAAEEGIQTHLVVVTDGALGGDSKDLVNIRNNEVHAAAVILGIDSVDCWQEADRGLAVDATLVSRIVQKVIELGAVSIFFPGPLELHPDHRTTALLVWAAIQKLTGEGAALNAYSYEIGVQNPVNTFIDITAQRPQKEQAMAVYASQNDENNYEELVLSLDKGRTFTLPEAVSHAEGFYLYSEEELAASLKEVTQGIIELYF
ncbi:MAG: diacetylchitobiose deacetylase [Pseudohongiella sp.]|nr:MAG: diacetylchitobiose deacetylase [Pseudohongiella sp.]